MRKLISAVLIVGFLSVCLPCAAFSQTTPAPHPPKPATPPQKQVSSPTEPPKAAPAASPQPAPQAAQPNVGVAPEKKSDQRTYLQKAFAPENLSNWLLAIVGICGIGMAYGSLRTLIDQARATRTAADASKIAADAALLNAQAVINSERAWIATFVANNSYDLYGHPDAVPKFQLGIKNSGRTPGVVSRILLKFEKRASLDDLPPDPPLDITSILVVNNVTIVPGEDDQLFVQATIDGEEALSSDERSAVAENRLFLLAYGSVIYTDVLKPDFANPHSTAFCFVYAVASPVLHGFQVCFETPPSYRERT